MPSPSTQRTGILSRIFRSIRKSLSDLGRNITRLFFRIRDGLNAPNEVSNKAKTQSHELTLTESMTSYAKTSKALPSTEQTATPAPIFEAYWESWNMQNLKDYGAQLTDVPVGKIGASGKVNYVDIAFGDYTFNTDVNGNLQIGYVNDQIGPNGKPFTIADLKAAIDKIHAQGGKVKLSFGGATFSMATHIKTNADAQTFANNVAKIIAETGLDGIDFDIEDGLTNSQLQLTVFKACRQKLGSNKLMTYTIPAMAELNDPYKSVISGGHHLFDGINVMVYDYFWSGYKPTDDFQALAKLGVPTNKIIWGIMPGQADDPNQNTTIADAKNIAQYVSTNGLGGVMMWDVNRDTNHRTGHSPGNNIYEDGQPDGSFTDAVTSTLTN